MTRTQKHDAATDMETNLRKACSQMLVLHLLKKQPCYIGEIAEKIKTESGERLRYSNVYCTIDALLKGGYITLQATKTSPDNRMRRYYVITNDGKKRYELLVKTYMEFQKGMYCIMSPAQN